MAMSVGPSESGDPDEVMSAINTTPLVDVMLVLLIIFLITIPVITKTVELKLPEISSEALKTKPENITIAINARGDVFWNNAYVRSNENILERVKQVAVQVPQPEIHIRADREARYEFIGRVVALVQRGGVVKVGFITDPELRDVSGLD